MFFYFGVEYSEKLRVNIIAIDCRSVRSREIATHVASFSSALHRWSGTEGWVRGVGGVMACQPVWGVAVVVGLNRAPALDRALLLQESSVL